MSRCVQLVHRKAELLYTGRQGCVYVDAAVMLQQGEVGWV